MTAICGAIGFDRPAVTEADMKRLVEALGRGPGRCWSGPVGRGWAALGGVGAGEPQCATDGSLTAVADTSSADPAESLLDRYRKWGPEGLLSRLSGPFALAIVDHSQGTVLLARDHLGQRPLVVAKGRGFLAFAPHALALTALEEIGHDLDETYVAEVLSLAYGSGRTFVQGVRWLGPGEALRMSAEGVRQWSWWQPPAIREGSLAEHADALRQAFDQAVASGIAVRGPTGVLMSGGLDSTSVAATAATLVQPAPLATYTAVPPAGWSGPTAEGFDVQDESLARLLAGAYPNVVARFVDVVGRPLISGLYEDLWGLGAGVPRNPCNFVWLSAVAEQAAADGIHVLLTGGVGNLAFSADGPSWLWRLLREGRLGPLISEARAWAGRPGGSWAMVGRHLLGPALPGPVRRARLRITGDHTSHERAEMSALRPELAELVDLPALYPMLDRRHHTPHRHGLLTVVADFAHQADTFAALDHRRGVEQRDPTADRRVWDVALAQPEYVRRHAGVSRAVVRTAMADRLPEAVLARRTVGTQLPDWLDRMGDARKELRLEIDASRDDDLCRRIIDVERLDRLERDWPPPDRAADPAIIRSYREALLRGLVIGRYLRWFQGHAAAARKG